MRVLLQGSDRLYLNTAEGLMRAASNPAQDSLSFFFDDDEEGAFEDRASTQFSVAANKQWIVVPIPYKYTSSNWPIRVSYLAACFLVHLRASGIIHLCNRKAWRCAFLISSEMSSFSLRYPSVFGQCTMPLNVSGVKIEG